MGLEIGKNYSQSKVQEAVRQVTGNNGLTVEIKQLKSGNATLVVGGLQLDTVSSGVGEKIKWSQGLQDGVKEKANNGNTLDWRSS